MGILGTLFGVGKLPPLMAAAAADPRALLVVEGSRTKASGSMKTSRRYASRFISIHGGALVVLPDRVLMSSGRYVVVDEWPGAVGEPISTVVRVAEDGLRVTIDVAAAVGGTGTVEVEHRSPIPPHVLAAFPTQEWQGTLAGPDPQQTLRKI